MTAGSGLCPLPSEVTSIRSSDVKLNPQTSPLCRSSVFIGDEEPDPASRAHPEEGRQRGGGVCFLSPAALEEGRGGLKPSTLHLGGEYVFTACTRQHNLDQIKEHPPPI